MAQSYFQTASGNVKAWASSGRMTPISSRITSNGLESDVAEWEICSMDVHLTNPEQL